MNIAAQPAISQSEQPIVSEGMQACLDGHAMTDNPYPATTHDGLRHHWLWDRGWYMADAELITAIAFAKIEG